MILPTPTDKAEAALLGRILLDEEDRAHGRRHGPRLLEQVRRWGITSAGLFGRGYHAELWSRIQEVAARGEHATRPAVHSALLEATDDEPAPDEPPAPHPETAAVTHLITTVDTAESVPTSTERCAGMVMDGAMHRSVHEMAIELARATRGEPGEVARTASGHKKKLQRMRQVWERLPGAARADLQALATPPPTPLERAQEDLGRARAWMRDLGRDPGYAAQMAAEPAWNIVDRLLGVMDTLASASVDAPRSPDPGARRFLSPGEILPDQEATAADRAAHDAQQHDDAPAQEQQREPMVPEAADEVAFAEYDARVQDPDRQAERDQREARLLGSVLAEPDQLDGDDPVIIDPQDWSPERRPVVELVRDIHDQGLAVDRLTLDWAAQHRGVQVDQEAIADPLQPREAEAGLAEHVKRDHAEQRVERAVDRLRTLGTEPTTGPEDLITSAETVLDEVGIDPPELDRPLGEAYVPETEREELGVPTARVSEEELTAAEEAELSRRG